MLCIMLRVTVCYVLYDVRCILGGVLRLLLVVCCVLSLMCVVLWVTCVVCYLLGAVF